MKLQRLPLMLLAIAALAGGIATGLRRIGWDVAGPGYALPLDHGPLMVTGFLGTLIGLERAVALGRGWVYAGPIASGLGMLAHLAGGPAFLAPASATIAGAVLVAALATVVVRHPTLFHVVMAVAAACWAIGSALWLGGAPHTGWVSWWVGFLVLTIAAERLELTRLLPAARGSRASFVAVAALLLAAVAAGGVGGAASARVTGLALALLAAWLVRYDIARRTIRQQALPRFTAVCLLSGYAWLGIGGALLLAAGAVVAGPMYDAVLHAVFLGFVFAMIFGHAPIVFPAVLGVAIPFRPAFYTHLALLHVSLLARFAADLASAPGLRRWSALLNAAAIGLFFVNTAAAVIRGRLHGDH
ncbi:MAG: hypothetical protein IT294_19070 [Deltaproteobacteria bacterium]|nr:hypothetical protein [Deltaproteobacteria bacterium]